jgi:hypothetical protein
VIDTTKAWFDAGGNGAAPTPGTIGQIGYADPTLTLILAGAGSQDIGPGKLGFEGAVGIENSFEDTDYSKDGVDPTWGNVKPTDDTYAAVTYGLGVGPGTLGFDLAYKFNGIVSSKYGYMWTLEPAVKYTGIGAGPVTLGVGLKYDYKFNGISTDNAEGREKGASFFHPYGDSNSIDQIKFWFDLDTAFGLYIKYEFSYGWGKDATGRASFAKSHGGTDSEKQGLREITNIATLEVDYKLGGLATIGLVVDDTGPGFRGYSLGSSGISSTGNAYSTETRGFTLKPFANFKVSALDFGAYLTFNNVMPTNVDEEVKIKPGVWVKYTL